MDPTGTHAGGQDTRRINVGLVRKKAQREIPSETSWLKIEYFETTIVAVWRCMARHGTAGPTRRGPFGRKVECVFLKGKLRKKITLGAEAFREVGVIVLLPTQLSLRTCLLGWPSRKARPFGQGHTPRQPRRPTRRKSMVHDEGEASLKNNAASSASVVFDSIPTNQRVRRLTCPLACKTV